MGRVEIAEYLIGVSSVTIFLLSFRCLAEWTTTGHLNLLYFLIPLILLGVGLIMEKTNGNLRGL